jgi:hypothetical protein
MTEANKKTPIENVTKPTKITNKRARPNQWQAPTKNKNQGHENTSRKTQPKAKKTLAKEHDQSNEKY